MPTLFLMVGLPGAGKTTRAKEIERERPALRLTPDDWMTALRIDLFDEAMRARMEAVQWQLAERALNLGVDVVLDFGFWGRDERDDFRLRAAALGARCELVYLDVPRDELLRRIATRSTVRITEEQFDTYIAWFQPPTRDESGHL